MRHGSVNRGIVIKYCSNLKCYLLVTLFITDSSKLAYVQYRKKNKYIYLYMKINYVKRHQLAARIIVTENYSIPFQYFQYQSWHHRWSDRF